MLERYAGGGFSLHIIKKIRFLFCHHFSSIVGWLP